jgi:aspartate/methionine/tyrosine aminotransferase
MLDIARLAEQHDLVVVSDELYDQLVYGPRTSASPPYRG